MRLGRRARAGPATLRICPPGGAGAWTLVLRPGLERRCPSTPCPWGVASPGPRRSRISAEGSRLPSSQWLRGRNQSGVKLRDTPGVRAQREELRTYAGTFQGRRVSPRVRFPCRRKFMLMGPSGCGPRRCPTGARESGFYQTPPLGRGRHRPSEGVVSPDQISQRARHPWELKIQQLALRTPSRERRRSSNFFSFFRFRLRKLLAVNENEYFTELQLKEEAL